MKRNTIINLGVRGLEYPANGRSVRNEPQEATKRYLSEQREYQGELGVEAFKIHMYAHSVPPEMQSMINSPFFQPNEFDERAFYKLCDIAIGMGVKLGVRNEEGFIGAYDSVNHSIRISTNITDADAMIVLAHELSHSLLHRGKEPPNRAVSFAMAETTVQTTAHLLLHQLGVDATEYSSVYVSVYRTLLGWRHWRRASEIAQPASRSLAKLAS